MLNQPLLFIPTYATLSHDILDNTFQRCLGQPLFQ
jgi:hypothetical protein